MARKRGPCYLGKLVGHTLLPLGLSVCVLVCVCTRAPLCVRVCAYVVCACTGVCVHACVPWCVHMWVPVCVWLRVCVCPSHAVCQFRALPLAQFWAFPLQCPCLPCGVTRVHPALVGRPTDDADREGGLESGRLAFQGPGGGLPKGSLDLSRGQLVKAWVGPASSITWKGLWDEHPASMLLCLGGCEKKFSLKVMSCYLFSVGLSLEKSLVVRSE